MNRRDRQAKRARAQQHQVASRAKRRESPAAETPVAAAPTKPRRRPASKKWLRAVGRKFRSTY